jgi:cobaltochelatase CobN
MSTLMGFLAGLCGLCWRRCLLVLGLLWLGLPGAGWAAQQLLWITGDVTPVARTRMVERLALESGLQVQTLDYPLRGAASLGESERRTLQQALDQSGLVWVDAPHASVETRLQGLLRPALQGWLERHPAAQLVWVPGEGSRLPQSHELSRRMAAYLQAGGERNLRPAIALAAALLKQAALPQDLPAPQAWPLRGLYHPDAGTLFRDAAGLARWQQQQSLSGLPPVAILVHRHHFVNGSTAWLEQWIARFRREGLLAYGVFGQQVDSRSLRELVEVDGRPHARVIVTHQLLTQAGALQPLFERWGLPVLATQIYRQGDQAAWERNETGLTLGDVPFYLAQPESAGAIDPLLVSAQSRTGEPVLIERQAQAVAAKARRLVRLQMQPLAQQRLVAMVYNYPAGGSNFGASFLNVPRSLERVSQGLAQAGYQTETVPEQAWIDGLKPLLAAYYPGTDLRGLLERNQADALPLSDYRSWFDSLPAAVRERILSHWGPPEQSRYLVEWQGRQVFVIPRLQHGTLSVLPQPPREETLHLGQNPFMHRSKVPLSHHYLAVYRWAGQADALIHFGTHGTQEWAPGKARGLDVDDDALLPLASASDHLPVVYPYIVDNLGEALTAKRRGRATLVSHRTPVFAPAGFNARMAQMHEVMHEWETVDAGPTRKALEKQLIAQFVEHQLHRDLGWSAERIAADFEGFLEQLHPYLDQLAQSSQPRGLAVFGQAPTPDLRRLTVLQAIRKPLIEALGEDIDEAFLIRHDAVAQARPARWLDVALQDADAASALDLRPALDTAAQQDLLHRAQDFVPNRAALRPIDGPALKALALRAQQLDALLAQEGEMPGLLTALRGGFVPAAYGGDPIRNPESLPTGRNLAGLDPSRLPTRQAYAVASTLFDDWLKGWQAAHGGRLPTKLALSLWAGETLRHQGVMEAQALVALGVRPVWDESGRPLRVELVSAQELQRERVDVLLSITGSYRDQFPALMALLDQAVALAAQAEPDNPVARHTRQVMSELRQRGVAPDLARQLAQARVFGNALGDYGTGIAEAVQSDGLRRDGQPGEANGGSDARLGELFLQRMSQPFVDGLPLALPPAAQREALSAHLRQSDAAVFSRSSNLYAMATSDDPFQYLGGLAAAARAAGKSEALGLYVSQLQDASEVTTETAQRAMALEMQSRYLHPGWLQAQQAEGYAGTLQVLKAVQFAWGWQAVAPGMVRSDHWQSFHDTLVRDKHQLGLPEWLKTHPQAYAQTLERLIQAQRLGYWQPDAATRQQLAGLYRELTRGNPLPNALSGVSRWVDQTLAPQAVPAVPQRQARVQPRQSEPSRAMRLGQLLQRVEPARPPLVWTLLALLLAAGGLHQLHRAPFAHQPRS